MVREVEYQGTYVQVGLEAAGVSDLSAQISEAAFDADPFNPGDEIAVGWARRTSTVCLPAPEIGSGFVEEGEGHEKDFRG